jgi:multiple sugar transport system permease protein
MVKDSNMVSVRKKFYIPDNIFAIGLVTPALIVLGAVIALPILRGIWISFCNSTLRNINKPTWNHFENYIKLFKTGEFVSYFLTTLTFVVLTVGIQFVLGLLIANLLNSKIVGQRFFRGLMIIPWTIPSVVVAIVWRWMLQQQYGVINYLIYNAGLSSTVNLSWIVEAPLAMAAIVIACAWKQLPYMTVMLLAGLQSVDVSLVEAAYLDGANRFQNMWHITLPSIRPVIITSLWLAVTQNFQQFTIINNLTAGGPVKATTTLSIAAFREAFRSYDFGTSAAIGVLWMVFLFVFTLITNKANEKYSSEIQ